MTSCRFIQRLLRLLRELDDVWRIDLAFHSGFESLDAPEGLGTLRYLVATHKRNE